MHRWRTQPAAIRNVNCRNQWIIEFLNANCALGPTWEHVCLSVTYTYARRFDILFWGCRTIAGNEPYRGFWRRPSGPALILGGFQCGAARFVILLFSIAAALEWHTSETLGQPLASNALLNGSRVDVQGAAKPSSVSLERVEPIFNFDLRSVKTTRWI